MVDNTLVTGWNGFLGSKICSSLNANGSSTIRCGRVEQSDIRVDLALSVPRITERFHRVIHVAGIVPSALNPVNTPDIFVTGNVKSTTNLLAGLTTNPPKSFVLISSVSVYGRTSGSMITESSTLSPTTEYARSKRDCETIVAEWCKRHDVILTIVRLPLVVGASATGTLGQLISAILKRRFMIPGTGSAKKSMVLATDVANWLATYESVEGTFNLTDGKHPSLAELCDAITSHLNLSKVPRIPNSIMKATSLLGNAGVALINKPLPYNGQIHTQLTESLTFSSDAANMHGWSPTAALADIDNWLANEVISDLKKAA